MSLIFNALQRFGRAGNEGTDGQENKPTKRHTRSHRHHFLSPGALLTLAGAIGITGFLAVQLVQSLSANARVKDSSVAPALTADERPSQSGMQLPVDTGPAINTPVSPQPVQTMKVSPPADGSPSAESHPEDANTSSQLVYYPPEPGTAAGQEASQPPGAANSSYSPPARPTGAQDRSMQKTDPAIPDRVAALRVYNEDTISETQTLRPAATALGMSGGDAPLPTARKSSFQEQKSAEIMSMEGQGALSEAAYRHQKARAAYQLNVTQLSHRIVSAMQSRDQALVGRLMKELEEAQGPDSMFLIRLKAYWQIQLDHLEKARELLGQVLAQKPDDKESGLNLAVVDMRDGRMERARRRLERLQRLYPEDDEIASALCKLHR